MLHMEGIFINGEKAKFHPEDILDTDASQYTEEIGESVTAYLGEHLTNPANPPIDTSLSIAGAAADAKKTGDELTQLKSEFTALESDGAVPSAEQILSDKGVTDSAPYHYRKTGGDGADRLYDQIVGGTVCWNQLVEDAKKSASIVTNNTEFSLRSIQGMTLYADTVYLLNVDANVSSNGKWRYRYPQVSEEYVASNVSIIKTSVSSNLSAFAIQIFSLDGQDATFDFDNIMLINLTAMFGSTLADYIYQLEKTTAGAGVAFFKSLFPNDYYPYNAGELVSVSGLSEHKMVGFNQWDEEWEVGRLNGSTGALVSGNGIRSKNYIPVFANTSYYVKGASSLIVCQYDENKNFISTIIWGDQNNSVLTSADAKYLKVGTYNTYGNVYKNDICINLSDPAKNGQYEPYKAHSYPLDSTVELRGISKLVDGKMCFDGDTYDADGTVTRKRRRTVIDGNTYKAISVSLNNGVYYTVLSTFKSDEKAVESDTVTKRIITNAGYNDYPTVGIGNVYITGSGLSTVICLFDQTLTDMTSVNNYFASHPIVMEYELATPTTEEAEPYQHLQQCDPNGTEEYVSTGIVPVGHNSFYPENLKSKIEGLPWNFASLIAPTESTFTATRNYTTGALFIVNNVLYKATSNIANGGTITPNTNCTATTLAEIISALA